jgi:Lon-like protease
MRLAPSPLRLLIAGVLVLVVAFVALLQVRSSDFLLVPDPAHPVAPLVQVQGGHNPRGPGGIYYVDVVEERASLLEKLIPALRAPGSSLVPRSDIIPPGADFAASRRLDRAMMQTSQQFAAAVALRSLGYHVVARPTGVQVDAVEVQSDADHKIVPGDVILAVDGKPTPTPLKLVKAVRRGHRVGQVVSVKFRRGGRTKTVSVRLTPATPEGPGARVPAIGLIGEPSASVKLPLRVSIDAGQVGGPSAGLAFALDVRAELGHDPTHGYRVVATGQINLDGSVGPIGGIEQKTFGARKAHADVFLVPAAGGNASDARRYAHGLRIVAVRSFAQALRALAALPPKPS